ncbi:MAG: hypothetical protein Fur0022_30600 [Anaerolineales bacterium]
MKTSFDFDRALHEVTVQSAGGAPFLIAYGVTFLMTGVLSFFLPRETTALIAMFQGSAALPVAFWLEGKMGWGKMSADNPLKVFSGQLAMSQAFAIPALIVAYSLNPGSIPVILAGLGGVHFFPYAWLHRTRIYAVLAGALALGGFALQVLLQANAFSVILLMIGVVYEVSAWLVYRHAVGLVQGKV